MNGSAPAAVGWRALLVALLAAALFAPSLRNGFAYDDVAVIENDERVHSLRHVGLLLSRGYWADDDLAIYRPLTSLSFALDWSLGFARPAWFHMTNVLLNAGAAVLAFLLLARFFAPAAALAGALFFAVHPVHVEAVANVVGRSELLAALFVLAALLLWLYQGTERVRIVRAAGVAVLFALGLAAKESAVVLLPLVLLLDAARGELRLSRPLPWLRANGVVLLALLLVLGLWVAARIAVLGDVTPTRVDAAFDVAVDSPARIWTALQAWPVWTTLLFAPITLLADYGPRVLMPIDGPTPAALVGAVILLGLSAGGIAALVARRTRTAIALLWFPITILPVSNLLVATGVIVAERTLYLPSLAAGFAIAALADRLAIRGEGHEPIHARFPVAVFALVLGLFAGRTLARIPAWASTDHMFAAQLHDRPDSFRAHWHLARQARSRGDLDTAAHLYDRSIELWPYRRRLVVEAAVNATELGRLPRARELAKHAVELDPGEVDAIRILAATSLDLGDSTTARQAVTAGLQAHPHDDVLQRMAAALHMNPETQ